MYVIGVYIHGLIQKQTNLPKRSFRLNEILIILLMLEAQNRTFFFPHFLKRECTKVAGITQVALCNFPSHVCVIVEKKIGESTEN